MELFESRTKKAALALFLYFAATGHGTALAFVLDSPRNYCKKHARVGAGTGIVQIATKVSQNDELISNIFANDIPLLDVRAEVEFVKGAFPNSVNIPILNDEQRHLVGTCYKQEGPQAAFDLGVELVTPVKEQRVKAWKEYAEANPTGYVYCFRGGSRSQISQGGLKEAGIDYPLVAGGYKAMRQFLIDELERVQDLPIVMVGGRTGSGKTHLLKHFAQHYVDLEGLANHRGSAFGGLVNPQPTQINFENALAIEFLKLRESGNHPKPIFIEEEGRRIGQLVLPLSMHNAMLGEFPVVELETPMEDRVHVCVQDYVTDMFPLFESAYGERAHEEFRQVHLDSLGRIKKRVPHYDVIYKQVCEALALYEDCGDESGFHEPTEAMLQYYDKMYDYQADQRKGEVLFRGDCKAIIEWAESEEGRRRLAAVS